MMTIWHNRLLEVVEELGGGNMTDIRRRFIEKYGDNFAQHDIAIINGTTNWYRKVQWARDDLVKEGKLAQQGEWVYIPKKDDSTLFHDPLLIPLPAMMSLPAAVILHLAVLIFFVLLLVMGGK